MKKGLRAEMSKKPIVLTVCLFFLPALFFRAEDAPCKEKEITITDARNRVVAVKQPVERIGFSGFVLTEAFKIIGVWDKIVAREFVVINKMFYPNIGNIPASCITRDNPYNLDFEKMLELDVDCFFTATAGPLKGFGEMNEKIKSQITVVTLDLFTHNTIKRNFEILGKVCGQSNKASDFINWYENVVNEIMAKTSTLSPGQKKKYFFKWSWGKVGEFTTMSDKHLGMSSINRIVGGINVAANLNGFGGWVPSVDPEWITEQDIDVIICEDMVLNGFGAAVNDSANLSSYRKKLMALPCLVNCKAVKNDDVYMISPDFLCAPGFVIYLAYLAKWFHPDLFQDFDPRSVHQEYLTRFMGVDFDLSKHGVFVYPDPDKASAQLENCHEKRNAQP